MWAVGSRAYSRSRARRIAKPICVPTFRSSEIHCHVGQTCWSCHHGDWLISRSKRETLESVSSCTRFSGFLTISSFGFNRLSSKLVSMFFGIVPMFVPKDFVSDCLVAQICANYGAHAHFGANLRDEAILNKIL